jgi:peptidoglycan/LPS O-acetylase OafA/YrhL
MIKKKEERFLAIDVLRALAIFLVILFHFLYEIYLNNDLRPIGFIGLSLFFIISGYVLAKNYPENKKFSWKWFLKRFVRIASLYYLAVLSIVLLFGRQTYSGKITDILLHLVFLDPLSKSAAYSIISPAWFLTPLIGLYLLYPYLNKYIKKDQISFLIIIFAIMAVFRTLDGTFTSYSPIFFIGEFCFGIAFASEKKNPALIISALTIFIRPIMFLPFLIFYFCYNLKLKFLPKKPFEFIGVYTFVFFLFHEAIIKVCFNKWHIFNLNLTKEIIVILIVIVICSYISKKIQDFFNNKKIFPDSIYPKSFIFV